MRRFGEFWTRKRTHRRWTLFLRAAGVVGLIAIPIAIWVDSSIPYVWLTLVGLPANSPLSPVLPTVWDPFLMEVAKYKPPAAVATVGVAIYMYSEFLNWHVYKWVLNWDRLAPLRKHRWVRWGVQLFGHSPIFAIIFFAATPTPFWVVRALAILKGYPIGRFMLATAVGRWPRFFAYAWLGDRLQIPFWMLVTFIVLTCGAVVAIRLIKHEKLLDDALLDGVDSQGTSSADVAPPTLESAAR